MPADTISSMTPTDLRGWKLRNWLRSACRRINAHPRKHAGHILALGRLFLEVKSKLPHGRFRDWIAQNCHLCYTDVRVAMRLAKNPPAEIATLRRFQPSVSRVLARKRLSKYGLGNLLRHASREDSVGYTDAACQISDTPQVISQPPAAESDAGRLVRLLGDVVEQASAVHIGVIRDADSPDTVESYMVSVFGEQRRHVTRSTLIAALAAVAGQEQTRECPTCRKSLSLDWFAKSTSNCRTCERKRVREATRAR